jgi:hypothetical protein
MTTEFKFDVTDQAAFDAAVACGKAGKSVDEKLLAYAQFLLPHVKGLAIDVAKSVFTPNHENATVEGVATRLLFINGAAYGRGFASYADADEVVRATLRKEFARAIVRILPKEPKLPVKGGVMSKEAAQANEETRGGNVVGNNAARLETAYAFLQGVVPVVLNALLKGEKPLPNTLATWSEAHRVALDAVKALRS